MLKYMCMFLSILIHTSFVIFGRVRVLFVVCTWFVCGMLIFNTAIFCRAHMDVMSIRIVYLRVLHSHSRPNICMQSGRVRWSVWHGEWVAAVATVITVGQWLFIRPLLRVSLPPHTHTNNKYWRSHKSMPAAVCFCPRFFQYSTHTATHI